ncbi:SusC/RagA family TonB-linked outer membrane protein [Pseudoflavitalea sp. X16]|uniref:SusC/RagA family TonB-linked outer membrane protein n=1 Tax=Paraflavitalea devenefica TaxID=2716334 RepID=UPI0014242B75|nr:SusC/RagA family TonB-linked outer membrane protein [Paraflavitalea devenefica]NII27494.1 SusC/RagA family TonB-linked outer membrane protein [Paraflavitalea devenefica]
MKLIAVLLTACCLQVSAYSGAQVTFSGKDVRLDVVFQAIGKQTGYIFLYSPADLKDTRPVTIDVKNVSIETIMKKCLEGQPLEFTIADKTVFIKRIKQKNTTVETFQNINTSPIVVRGRVINEEGEPLVGTSVIVKRTKEGTLAGIDGTFSITGVSPDDILLVSYTGYKTLSVEAESVNAVPIKMELANNELDEAIVRPYGKITRRLNTGNIARISADEIQRQPVMNPLLALQGKVANLVVSQTSGYASAPVSVTLRGKQQIDLPTGGSVSSDPLYIIDGVPLVIGGTVTGPGNSSNVLASGFGGPALGQSPLFSIDPSTIESIEVFKDADAISIYGSRGANGVIVITTKKARVGTVQTNGSFRQGISKVTKKWEMLSTKEYLEMRREALKNDDLLWVLEDPIWDPYVPDIKIWDSSRNIDWQDIIFGGTGRTSDAQLCLSGGNTATKFYLGGAYSRFTDVLTVSGANQRGSIQFDFNQKIAKNFGVELSANYSSTKNNLRSLSPDIAILLPNAPDLFTKDGQLNWQGWVPLQYRYPMARLYQPYNSIGNNLISNLILNYEVFKGASIKTSIGFTESNNNQIQFFPAKSRNPELNPKSYTDFGFNRLRTWIIEPQINYNFFLGKHKISTLLGASIQKNTTSGSYITGTDYASDALMGSMFTAGSVRVNSDNFAEYKYFGGFARISYDWFNKYLLNVSVRRDGSSKFGFTNRFGTFYSVAGAWIFSQEGFLKNSNVVSFGKLRGSLGLSGSDGVGDYAYLSQWTRTPNYNGAVAITSVNLLNPNYQWQETKMLEGAIELGLFDDRIVASFSIYRNRCGNQLTSVPISFVSGFPSVVNNSPATVQNSGWEININAKAIRTKNFSWSLTFNTGQNRNKLLAFPNLESSPYASIYEIGKPLSIIRLLHFTGVDPQTGLYTFEDKNKDGVISTNPGESDDRYQYTMFPKFNGGLGSDFAWKGFQVNFFFNIAKQMGYNAFASINPAPGFEGMSNMPKEVMKRWQKPGDITSIAKFSATGGQSYNDFRGSDGIFTDASFIRLSNVSIAYSLEDKVSKKIGLNSFSFFFQGQNIFVITNYKGVDPETQNFGMMPPLKTVVAGIKFSL